jgi:hypothetical protein
MSYIHETCFEKRFGLVLNAEYMEDKPVFWSQHSSFEEGVLRQACYKVHQKIIEVLKNYNSTLLSCNVEHVGRFSRNTKQPFVRSQFSEIILNFGEFHFICNGYFATMKAGMATGRLRHQPEAWVTVNSFGQAPIEIEKILLTSLDTIKEWCQNEWFLYALGQEQCIVNLRVTKPTIKIESRFMRSQNDLDEWCAENQDPLIIGAFECSVGVLDDHRGTRRISFGYACRPDTVNLEAGVPEVSIGIALVPQNPYQTEDDIEELLNNVTAYATYFAVYFENR